jgi:hypothetical protein
MQHERRKETSTGVSVISEEKKSTEQPTEEDIKKHLIY